MCFFMSMWFHGIEGKADSAILCKRLRGGCSKSIEVKLLMFWKNWGHYFFFKVYLREQTGVRGGAEGKGNCAELSGEPPRTPKIMT